MTNFNIAYEKWLQIYQAERNFKLNYDLLAHDLEELAKQLNLKFTPKDKFQLSQGQEPKDLLRKIKKGNFNNEYSAAISNFRRFENSRKNELYKLEEAARFELFNHIGTIPPEIFYSPNLSLFCTYDVTPDPNGNFLGAKSLFTKWVNQLSSHGFTVKASQASWHYGDQWNPVLINAVYANVNDKLKYTMCYPLKQWEVLQMKSKRIQQIHYCPNYFGYQSYLFEPDFVPTELMQDFKVCEL